MSDFREEWAFRKTEFVVHCVSEEQARSLAEPSGEVLVREVTEWRVADE